MLTKITLALAFFWSYDLRVQHVSVRQLGRHGRPLLSLNHPVRDQCCYIGRWPAQCRPSSLLVGLANTQ
jgi:hypothetical protein